MIGSGLLVEHRNQYPAFLTAVHVVIQALRASEFRVALFDGPDRVLTPSAIRFAKGSDAALLSFEKAKVAGMLSFADWGALTYPDAAQGETAFCIGYPGELSKSGDPTTQKKGTVFGTVLAAEVQSGLSQNLVHAVIARGPAMPRSFGGMSGGPVIGDDGRLLGINTAEEQADPMKAHIFFTRRRDWEDLANPYLQPAGSPTDYWKYDEKFSIDLELPHPATGKPIAQFRANFFGRVLISESARDKPLGALGMISHMTVDGSRFPINIEVVYGLADSEDKSSWEQEFKYQCSLIVSTMGLKAAP